MHLSDILKGFPDPFESLQEEHKLEDLDKNEVYIPKLRKISDVNIIKPMNKIVRIEVLKEDSPMNFKIVFTIKGLAEACSDTLHSKSNYYVTIQNPNGKLKSCLISQEDINKAKNLRKISEIDNSYYDDPSELKFEK